MEGHLVNSTLQRAGRRAEPSTTPVYVRERLPVKQEEWAPETNHLRSVLDSVQHQPGVSSSGTIVKARVGMGAVVPVATSLNYEERDALGSLLEPLQVHLIHVGFHVCGKPALDLVVTEAMVGRDIRRRRNKNPAGMCPSLAPPW